MFRVCLDARIRDTSVGGVMQSILGTAAGLRRIADSDERYHLLTLADASEWVQPVLGGAVEDLPVTEGTTTSLARRAAEHVPMIGDAARRVVRRARGARPWTPAGPPPAVTALEPDVVHLIRQEGFRTDVPTVYHPHDLQHLHLPELFAEGEVRRRERMYRFYCAQSAIVVALTTWARNDLLGNYGLPEDKVVVVPWASVLDTYPTPTASDTDAFRKRHDLEPGFLFYPAQMWAHKNHARLLTALDRLRRDGLHPQLVLTGSPTPHTPAVRREIDRLGLTGQVRLLGFVSPLDMACLYADCRAVVFPSRFEGWGMPVLEAMSVGKAIACSTATSLPALVGDAGLLFDPEDPDEMAQRIRSILTDDDLTRRLGARGRSRAAEFTWERTARQLRAHYRIAAGHSLEPEDHEVLAAPPLV